MSRRSPRLPVPPSPRLLVSPSAHPCLCRGLPVRCLLVLAASHAFQSHSVKSLQQPMSSEANDTVARRAPTEQQESKPGTPKRFAPGQTVCNEKNEKGKLCNGHLKELDTQHPAESFLRGDDVLYGCQACGALYMGPPLGHVRDPRKQRRYVERDLAAILQAAGGTLPVYDYPTPAWRGEAKPRAVAAKSAAKPSAATSAPAGETPEQ